MRVDNAKRATDNADSSSPRQRRANTGKIVKHDTDADISSSSPCKRECGSEDDEDSTAETSGHGALPFSRSQHTPGLSEISTANQHGGIADASSQHLVAPSPAFDPDDHDVFFFRSLGYKIQDQLRKLGETFHGPNGLFSLKRHGEASEADLAAATKTGLEDHPESTLPMGDEEYSVEKTQSLRQDLADTAKLLLGAVKIPFYRFSVDDYGRKGVPVISSLLKIYVTNSDDNVLNYNVNTMFTMQLQYGDQIEWTVRRRILDFVKLHTILTFRHIQGHLPKIPHFPSQLSYLVDISIFKSLDRDTRREQRARLTLERRKGLENYMNELLWTLNMHVSTELAEFLECSTLSISATEWKAKEGYLKNRIFDVKPKYRWYSFLLFWLPERKKFQTKWFLIRSSYIAYVDFIDQTTPSDVLLCDQYFRISIENEHSANPLKPFSVTIFNGSRKLEVRPESNTQMKFWLEDLRTLSNESLWCHSHRFGSFCPVRGGVDIKWYVDAEGYYADLVDALLAAKEEIFIHGWWVSPELYLRRPAAEHPETRLDLLLQARARAGVKIYIVIFKEISMAFSINSHHTKVTLERLHPNIRVQRHPDHITNGVLYWAHHEKIVVIDQKVAFSGGLDLCYGRYDSCEHKMTDYSPAGQTLIKWIGLDYSNPRIRDFRNVSQFGTSMIDRKREPRMPWHDIHSRFTGQAARDMARHFIQSWNFIKTEKSMHKEFHIPFLLPKRDFTQEQMIQQGYTGSCRVQLVRSIGEWSMGMPPELSIYDAYLHYIEHSKHFIFIENQFFISKCSDGHATSVRNRIACALIDRIVRAFNDGANFRVIVFMPLLPAFEADVNRSEASSVRLIMQAQYDCISRGLHSILGGLRARGISPDQYISFFSLRKHDMLNGSLVTEQIYIHSKMMIVDDTVAILGSANLNDRSMLGVRDSEINLIVEDDDQISVTLNGQAFRVGRKVQALRKQLLREHLGWLDLDDDDPAVRMLDDPVSGSFYFGVLRHQASLNTQIYRQVFHCVPDDCVSTWEEYRDFTELAKAPTSPNDGDPSSPKPDTVSGNLLKRIRGNIVLFPTLFLNKEALAASVLTPQYLLPMEVYI